MGASAPRLPRQTLTSRASPTRQKPSDRATKTWTEPVPRNQPRFSSDVIQLVLVLHQFCTNEQLFPPPLRATLERKLNYETTLTILPREPARRGGPASGRLEGHTAPSRHPPQFQIPQTWETSTGRIPRLTLHESSVPSHGSKNANHAPPITSRSTSATALLHHPRPRNLHAPE